MSEMNHIVASIAPHSHLSALLLLVRLHLDDDLDGDLDDDLDDDLNG